MMLLEALRNEANLAHAQVGRSLETVTEPLAWAQLPLTAGAYLHTNATILGIVQHLAGCKFMYGSSAFRGTEVRWRNVFDRLELAGVEWRANLAYLEEAHTYWISTWADWATDDLEQEVPHFSGKNWPMWKIIATVTQHDAYHAGQIEMLASALESTNTPPDLDLDGERQHVVNLPGW